jgi:hypothetical protein
MALIPQSCNLDNEGHQALDEDVLQVFELYIDMNKEPKWDALLCNIVNNDGRLSQLSKNRVHELLKHESSLMAVLQKGWKNLI